MQERDERLTCWLFEECPAQPVTNLPQIHVRLVDHRWAVLRADETYPVSTHPRREDAITVARALAVRENAEVVLFDEIGKPPPPPGQSPPPGGASGQACL